MKKILTLMISLLLAITLFACKKEETVSTITISTNDNTITLGDENVVYNNEGIKEYDYTWNIDPSKEEPWYEGEEPSGDIYIAHDIIYYPELDVDNFTKEVYDEDTEWVYHYTNDSLKNYIFSTLPILGEDVPTEMMYSEEEAYENKVLHITKAGTYTLEGYWHGQILVDLSEDAYTDETQKVTLILNGAHITCDVAPAIVFKNVYEVDNTWEEREVYSGDLNVGEMETGATIIIADDTENDVIGANVYRLLKPTYKNDETTVQKKLYKTDGALYSFMSLNINGEIKNNGVLNITSTTYEGLDTELHLGINGGVINIETEDDGINVNEDDVSVLTINGGRLTILAGLGAEGDGIDSNGYVTINDGEIWVVASPYSDNGIDAAVNTKIIGGKVIALGSNMSGTGNYTVYINGEQQYTESNKGGLFNGGNQGGINPNDGGTPPEMPDSNFNPNGADENTNNTQTNK